jgi:hypothetical protein
MQVSNSTGQGSEYRLGSNAGGMIQQQPAEAQTCPLTGCGDLISGCLKSGAVKAHTTEGAIYVEFQVDGHRVAAWFSQAPENVRLVEHNGAFAIEATCEREEIGEIAA